MRHSWQFDNIGRFTAQQTSREASNVQHTVVPWHPAGQPVGNREHRMPKGAGGSKAHFRSLLPLWGFFYTETNMFIPHWLFNFKYIFSETLLVALPTPAQVWLWFTETGLNKNQRHRGELMPKMPHLGRKPALPETGKQVNGNHHEIWKRSRRQGESRKGAWLLRDISVVGMEEERMPAESTASQIRQVQPTVQEHLPPGI